MTDQPKRRDPRPNVHLKLTPEEHDRLKQLAARENRSLANYLLWLIRRHLEETTR